MLRKYLVGFFSGIFFENSRKKNLTKYFRHNTKTSQNPQITYFRDFPECSVMFPRVLCFPWAARDKGAQPVWPHSLYTPAALQKYKIQKEKNQFPATIARKNS